MTTSKLFTAQEYADLLKTRVGKQYVLGQPIPYNTPDPQKLDCSGLVIWANNISGALITGDDTAAGLYNRSVPVTGALQTGDLVFLRNNPARSNGIGHMAVLSNPLTNGDWRIVEAKGKNFGVVNTTLSYWRTRKYYTGVRRLRGFKLSKVTTPPPPVTPPAPKTTKFWASTYNALDIRFGGKYDDVAMLKKLTSSVFCLTEANSAQRTYIRNGLKGGQDRWKVWTRDDKKSQSILFDATKWSYDKSYQMDFGPTSYHGAVWAFLTRKETGKKILFISLHMPANNVSNTEARQSYFRRLMAKISPLNAEIIILGGDFNESDCDDWVAPYGFVAASTGNTTNSGKRLDWLFIRGGEFTSATVIDAGKSSDHDGVRVHVKIVSGSTL